jgi:hypothetical protein
MTGNNFLTVMAELDPAIHAANSIPRQSGRCMLLMHPEWMAEPDPAMTANAIG